MLCRQSVGCGRQCRAGTGDVPWVLRPVVGPEEPYVRTAPVACHVAVQIGLAAVGLQVVGILVAQLARMAEVMIAVRVAMEHLLACTVPRIQSGLESCSW